MNHLKIPVSDTSVDYLIRQLICLFLNSPDLKLYQFAKHLNIIMLSVEKSMTFYFLQLFHFGTILLAKIISYYILRSGHMVAHKRRREKDKTLTMNSVFSQDGKSLLFLSITGRTPVLRVSVVTNHCVNIEPSYSLRYCDQVTCWGFVSRQCLRFLSFSTTSGRLLGPPSPIH
jgi:hypothetical protein